MVNVVHSGLDISQTAARVGAFRYGVGVEAYSEIKLRDTTNMTDFYTALDALPSGVPAGNDVTFTGKLKNFEFSVVLCCITMHMHVISYYPAPVGSYMPMERNTVVRTTRCCVI